MTSSPFVPLACWRLMSLPETSFTVMSAFGMDEPSGRPAKEVLRVEQQQAGYKQRFIFQGFKK